MMIYLYDQFFFKWIHLPDGLLMLTFEHPRWGRTPPSTYEYPACGCGAYQNILPICFWCRMTHPQNKHFNQQKKKTGYYELNNFDCQSKVNILELRSSSTPRLVAKHHLVYGQISLFFTGVLYTSQVVQDFNHQHQFGLMSQSLCYKTEVFFWFCSVCPDVPNRKHNTSRDLVSFSVGFVRIALCKCFATMAIPAPRRFIPC